MPSIETLPQSVASTDGHGGQHHTAVLSGSSMENM